MVLRIVALLWLSACRGTAALSWFPWTHWRTAASGKASTPASQETAGDAVALAEQFDSPRCRRAIKDASLEAWAKIVFPEHPALLGERQEVFQNSDIRVAYIRNQKAGSTYMQQNLPAIFNSTEFPLHTEEYQTLLRNRKHRKSNVTEEYFAFTMVRDPLVTAFAAYLEVSRRSDVTVPGPLWDLTLKPRYRNWRCDTRRQRTKRFKTYLQEILERDHLGDQSFHSFPQALKINVYKDPQRSQRFDAIAKMENLASDLRRVQVLAVKKVGHRLSYAEHNPPAVPDESANGQANKNEGQPCEDVNFQDPELMRMICDMYKVDYVCLNYTLPSECQ